MTEQRTKRRIEIAGDRVTSHEVEAAITKEVYTKLGDKMTACHLTLVDGFEVVGLAGVVDPEKYDIEIGSRIAKEKAMDKVWSHMGSILQDRLCYG